MEEQLFSLFGVNFEHYVFICGVVFFLMEAAKKKWTGYFLGGWRTDVLALCISLILSLKFYYPKVGPIIAATLLCWLVPIGVHKVKKGSKS